MALSNIDTDNILLVEAESDRGLFEQILKKLAIDTKIQVACPKDFDPKNWNTKQAVLAQTVILLKTKTDNDFRLAVVVDADYPADHSLGLQKTLAKFKEKIADEGYALSTENSNHSGFIFTHNDGLTNIGLWVMPDNNNNGMLEHWIKNCVSNEEQALFDLACSTVTDLKS